ncbi:MAG: transglutaminase family protein [Kofleriaceae bacterium]|nr:transglutaminase family protein [Kofleriaceae bacterium]
MAIALTWLVINHPGEAAVHGVDASAVIDEVAATFARRTTATCGTTSRSGSSSAAGRARDRDGRALDRGGYDRQRQDVYYRDLGGRAPSPCARWSPPVATTTRARSSSRRDWRWPPATSTPPAGTSPPPARTGARHRRPRRRARRRRADPDATARRADAEAIVDAVALAADDVAAGRLTAATAGAAYRASLDRVRPAPELVAAHEAALVDLALATDHAAPDADAARRLVARAPDSRLAATAAADALTRAGRDAEAQVIMSGIRTRAPTSALVASFGAPDPDDWLTGPDALTTALAGVGDRALWALEPERVVFGSAEVFLPGPRATTTNPGVFDLPAGGRLGVLEAPNPTRCTGQACLELVRAGFDASWTLRWSRAQVVAGQPGGLMRVDGPVGAMVIAVVPSGGRLFQVVTVVPPDRPATVLAAMRLAHDTLRALDLLIPADHAETARGLAMTPPLASRLEARRALGRPGCGWAPSYLTEPARGALLLDVALLGPEPLARALACARPGAAVAPLAALALIAGDPSALGFAGDVAARHPREVIASVRILAARGQTQASQAPSIYGPRPSRAWLALAAVLPADARDDLVAMLLGSSDAAGPPAGLLIAALLPTPQTRGWLRDQLEHGRPARARMAVEALPRPFAEDDLAALRRRLDRTIGRDPATRHLERSLTLALHAHGAPADRARVTRSAIRLGLDLPRARPRSPAGGPRTPLDDATLRGAPLPALLDGSDWSYARAPQPAALADTLAELLRRVELPSPTDRFLLDQVASAARGPLSLLGDSGGLDLARPIECASLDDDFVCAAGLADAAAFERALATWPEAIAAIRFPEVAAISGALVGSLAGAAPLIIDGIGADDDEARGPGADGGRVLVRERARLTHTLHGRTLVRHLIVTARDDGDVEIDGPWHAVIGDRVFVFGSLALATQVLTDLPAPGASLADDAGFRADTADWVAGVVAQGRMVDGRERATFALAPEAEGLRFRVRSVDGPPTTPARAVGHLPPGARTYLAATRRDDGQDLETIRETMGPWRWLFEHSADFAFGWYPAGDHARDGWVAAARRSKALERRLAARGLGGLGPRVRRSKGLFGARRDDHVIIGDREDLVVAALARAPGGDDRTWVSRLDGPALAAALRARPSTDDEQAGLRTVAALAVELVGTTEADSRRVGGADVVEGVIRPRLVPADDARAVVDRWLATPSLRNTTRLPRDLTPAEIDRPLAFLFDLADARTSAPRLFPATPRTRVEVLDDRRVRVVVSPAPGLTAAIPASPLDDDARRRALADGADLRTGHPRLRALARELVPRGTSPREAAVAVGAWVHRTLRYEVTEHGGDTIAILERGTGDCTEYALLTVAILRAAGVPATIRSGVAAGDGELVAHAWVAFHDGTGWREIDPTWGRTSVGADHIETSVLDFVTLVSLDGLAITAVEPAAAPAP